jgi:lysophospholipase L1-like esterase
MPDTRKYLLIEGRRAAAAGHVLVTGLICLGLATFLNAASLLRTAERQPLGATRTLAVGIMSPLAEMSGVLFLDRPRGLVDRALGRVPAPEEPDEPADPVIIHPEGWDGGTSTTSTTVPGDTTTTTTTVPAADLREITAAEPLNLWIIGDSFVELFGPALENDAADTGVMETEVDFRFISGLVRSDYFDWPAHIEQRLPEVQPDAVVVMFGGNDGQPLTWQGVELQPDTPEWLEIYHMLVGEAMDTLLVGTTRVYWVGLPIMRDDRFTERVIGFNEVYREEAAKRPGVVYVDIFDLFKDENGEYSTYLRTESGDLLDMRMEDGAHFSWNGAYRLSGFVLEAIAADWGFTNRL